LGAAFSQAREMPKKAAVQKGIANRIGTIAQAEMELSPAKSK
jgi:hypothetical protein